MKVVGAVVIAVIAYMMLKFIFHVIWMLAPVAVVALLAYVAYWYFTKSNNTQSSSSTIDYESLSNARHEANARDEVNRLTH